MDWFFNGLGTLLVGLVVGGAGGSAITWRVAVKRSAQKQHGGKGANQIQAGRDVKF